MRIKSGCLNVGVILQDSHLNLEQTGSEFYFLRVVVNKSRQNVKSQNKSGPCILLLSLYILASHRNFRQSFKQIEITSLGKKCDITVLATMEGRKRESIQTGIADQMLQERVNHGKKNLLIFSLFPESFRYTMSHIFIPFIQIRVYLLGFSCPRSSLDSC